MSERELRDAEVEAWKRSGPPAYQVTSDVRDAHLAAFRAGIAFARRTPGPATAKLARLVGVLVKRAALLEVADSEPIEIRMDGASAWISLADAKAFVAELIIRRSHGPADATHGP